MIALSPTRRNWPPAEGHPERPERVAAIIEAIAKSDLHLEPEPPRRARIINPARA